MFSTITAFGTPRNVSRERFAIETFHLADPDGHRRLSELNSLTASADV